MRTWTQEETETLLQNYNKVSNEGLCMMLPSKTALAIYKKAYKMGLRKAPEIEHINRSIANKGEKCAWWNGGISISSKGYRFVRMPEHRRADRKGYVLEHILVFERECGIQLPDNCCIHHLNGVKDDNRIENLCMMTCSSHTTFHHTGAKRTAETKKKISDKAKERFSDPTRHPLYLHLDIEAIKKDRATGMSVSQICQKYGISKSTYYTRTTGYRRKR